MKLYPNIALLQYIAIMQYIAIFEVAICNITNWHIVSALVHTYMLIRRYVCVTQYGTGLT